MSFLQQLQQKRLNLQSTTTTVTLASGERYIENHKDSTLTTKFKDRSLGFVVDTKPDEKAACILEDFLYLGSQDAVTISNISRHNLTHILSVGIEMPKVETPKAFESQFLPCLDLPETQLFSSVIDEAIVFIDAAHACQGRVLVHCNAGVSRSASLVIAYLMKRRKMQFEDAFALVKSRRPCIQPNAGFMRQLRSYK